MPPTEVLPVSHTTVLLTLENNEFIFAPHDFQTAMMILTSYAMRNPESKGNIKLENFKQSFELGSCDLIRASMDARRNIGMGF